MKNYYKTSTILAIMLISIGMYAQFTASGVVSDDIGEPLIGVAVTIQGTSTGTITDIDGRYSLAIPGEEATLEFNYLGYGQKSILVNALNTTANISLSESSTDLDEVVVTGLASGIKRKNSANAIATISAKELAGVTTVETIDGAITGKITGAYSVSNSGAPGGGVSIKLRGISTINGSSEPLYIVDGIYVDNSAFSSGTNPVSMSRTNGEITDEQDNAVNRIADINPADIESIEVLKGPSTAAIYGARANAGVIIINTKSGKTGNSRINFSQSFGTSSITRKLGLRDYTSERVKTSFDTDTTDTNQLLFEAARDNGTLINYEDEIYGNTGILYNGNLSFAGGTDKTKYYISGGFKTEDGIIKNTGYDRISGRINIKHKISDFIDIAATTYYVNSSADRSLTNNDNAGVSLGIALTSTPPWAQLRPNSDGVYPDNSYAASNPLQTRDLSTLNDLTNRFIGGATINLNLLRKDDMFLKFRLRGGLDRYTNETTVYFPENLQFMRGGLNGFYSRGNNTVLNSNFDGFLVLSTKTAEIDLTSQLGFSRLDFDQERLITQATQLIGAQQNLNQAGAIGVFNRRLKTADLGYIFQQEANWQDKIIATAGIRFDKSTLFGDPNKLYAYPKASLAINFGEFDFFQSNVIDVLKIRGAYGQAGGVPVPDQNDLALATQTIFNGTSIGGNAGSIIGATRGNLEIDPERAEEMEFGVDISVLDELFLLEATYYSKRVKDLILAAEVAESQGFATQVTNAGELKNTGIELSLTSNTIRSKNVYWQNKLNWWRNSSKVTRLDIPSFTDGAFASGLGIFKVEEGKSPTQIVGTVPGMEGDVVLGNSEPNFQMSWFSAATLFKNFEISMLWHWKSGGENIELSTLLSDFGGTTYDYDDDDDGNGVINGIQRVEALTVESDAREYIVDAGFVKLREVGLYYNLPESILNTIIGGNLRKVQIGFSGQNVALFTDYRSYDPEVSNFGRDPISSGVEVTPFPSSRRLFFHLNVGF